MSITIVTQSGATMTVSQSASDEYNTLVANNPDIADKAAEVDSFRSNAMGILVNAASEAAKNGTTGATISLPLYGATVATAIIDDSGVVRAALQTTFDGLAEILAGQVALEQNLS
jgi:hypothetical protein